MTFTNFDDPLLYGAYLMSAVFVGMVIWNVATWWWRR